MNLTAIPHTKLQISFKGTVAVQYFPQFKLALLGEHKLVRQFYKRTNLADFYPVKESLSAVMDNANEAVLAFMSGAEYAASAEFVLPGYADMVDELKEQYEVEPDSVYLAGNNVKWKGKLSAGALLPYRDGSISAIDKVVIGTQTSSVITTNTITTLTGALATSVAETLLFKVEKVGTAPLFISVPAPSLRSAVDLNLLSEPFALLGSVSAYTAATLTCSASGTDLEVTTADIVATSISVTATYIDTPSANAFPAFVEKAFLLWERTASPATLTWEHGLAIQKNTVIDGDDNRGWVEVTPRNADAGFYTLKNVKYQELIAADQAAANRLNLTQSFYTNTETTATGAQIALTTDWSLVEADINELSDLTNYETDELFICDVHAEFTAKFSTVDNTYINRVYSGRPTEGEWPFTDNGYPWGLPHPSNPLGFAVEIAKSTIGGDTSNIFVVVAEDKATSFELIQTLVPTAMFIANVWEEYGVGISEGAWLQTQDTDSGKYPLVFTYVRMNPFTYKVGTETDTHVFPATATAGSNIVSKDGSDPISFITAGVTAGDTFDCVYSDGTARKINILSATASSITLSRKMPSSGSVSYTVYRKMTSEEARVHYVSKLGTDRFNLFTNLNRSLEWGSHTLENKWWVPAMAAMRTVYPEQQPMTGVLMDMGRFGRTAGSYDFFKIGDLDKLVQNGYYIFTTDPGAATSYVIRDVTAGLKSFDYRRGEGQAAIPICTFGASAQAVVDQLKGKYTKSAILVEKVKLSLAAVTSRYTATPSVPELGPKLRVARIASITAITGGYNLKLQALPHEQANIFEIDLEVIGEEEA